MKTLTKSVVDRLLTVLIDRAMPLALDSYYGLYSPRWHPHYALRQAALAETVAYIREKMAGAMIKANEFEVLSYAVQQVTLTGLFLEFGVRTGTTINHLARRLPGQTIYGFDSFEGLPEAWRGWVQDKGAFGGEGLPRVRDNVRLVKGWFEQSLPEFLAGQPGPVAFMHIDSDLYSSAKTIFEHLTGRIGPGTIIVFNEYFNYPNWQAHEYKAFQEFCAAHQVSYDYLCWGQFEVAVKILAISPPQEALCDPQIKAIA